MLAHDEIKKRKANNLRRKGLTLEAIHTKIKVPVSSLSRWLKSEKSPRQSAYERVTNEVDSTLRQATIGKNESRILCALIYWCEGGKSTNDSVAFTNSDPALVKAFLKLLRSGFQLDERKFRICMHLHDYHDERRQKNYWSEATGIPQSQFTKTYQKISSHRYSKKEYAGCIRIRYYDNNVARALLTLAQKFMAMVNKNVF